ncbi:MAG TPA: inositol monophosphatase family protein [Gemmatimonadaceae bacterium]|nr:inositol monophosphatase family protein [Gemmatimonadaceae bacterium]
MPDTAQASTRDARALLATCVAACVRASEIVRQGAARLGELRWEKKGPSDFVSVVDRDAEHALTDVIRARHPDAVVIAEEGSPKATPAALTFVADPLDGTTNFLHGFPWYAVSIAALVDGAHVAAAVINAASGELFTATLGGGTRRNGQPVRVSSITDPALSLIGTGFPFKHREGIQPYMDALPRLMEGAAGLRRAGSAALDLCDVACGRYEAFWELRLAPWDVAAGILLVREAGGRVTDLLGKPAPVDHGPIVAGNPAIHAWLLSQLAPQSNEITRR